VARAEIGDLVFRVRSLAHVEALVFLGGQHVWVGLACLWRRALCQPWLRWSATSGRCRERSWG
jgi:hypothetical protein